MKKKTGLLILISYGAIVSLGCTGTSSSVRDVLTLPVGDAERSDQRVTVQVDTVVNTLNGNALSPQALGEYLTATRLVLVAEQHTS